MCIRDRPPVLSKQVKDLSITYSRLYLYERLGRANGLSAEERIRFSDVTRPLVTRHPVTQREALVFSIEECKCIDGMNESQSYEFLRQLLELITAENQIYRHQWRVGDLVCWDIRTAMHMALGDFDESEFRHMLRTTLQGEKSGYVVAPAVD